MAVVSLTAVMLSAPLSPPIALLLVGAFPEQDASASDAKARIMRIESLRIFETTIAKKRLPGEPGSLACKTAPEGAAHYMLVVVFVVVVVVVVFVSTAFMSVVAFMSTAFMSTAFMSFSTTRFSAVRFSTAILLSALLLLLQAATARAAPATRIRARIQNSLFIAICSGRPLRKSHSA
jgi:hypothetical protein